MPELLDEIETFLGRTGMGETYFGKKAVGNSELVARLRSGGRVWPETAEAVRDFISNSSPSDAPSSEGARPEDFLPTEKRGGANPDVQGSGIHDLDGNAA